MFYTGRVGEEEGGGGVGRLIRLGMVTVDGSGELYTVRDVGFRVCVCGTK
jgi:hypothetical protein